MTRIENPSKAEALLKQRRAQIERAYQARLKPKMTKAARQALEAERVRQLALARKEYARLSHAKAAKKKAPTVYIPRKTVAVKTKKKQFKPPKPRRSTILHPIGGVAQIVKESRKLPPARKAPVSSHWEYFDQSGQPAAPWEIDILPGSEYDVKEEDEGMFADEDYSYEDIETDWGGYEHQDTGYPDENA